VYPATARTTPTRLADRVSYDRDTAHQILDEAYVCHLGIVVDGLPKVLPTLHVRVGDTLYLHGSTGSGPMRALRDGGPVCVTVTLHDGLVYARSHFHHSANYRSVVCYGTATVVRDDATRREVLDALIDKLGPGRSAQSRRPNAKELAATAVVALPLTEVSVKVRGGGVKDDEEDLGLPYWAGVVPLRLVPGVPEPDAGVTRPVPDYTLPARSPWFTPVVLEGDLVHLEPLDLCHIDELFTALDHAEVWQHLPYARPTGPAGLRAIVAAWLAEPTRCMWVQKSARTGEAIGTTAYSPADEQNRAVHIGTTHLGRAWWRSGINTEAKLLLMSRAFDELGAVRVEWQTDARNLRSRAAIERLGATREGVLRQHKKRADGTHRDSVFYGMTAEEWPAAKARLTERLARG
jgi:nitroimidazol reductase NimA-like FMN-containing flavoprotein (pyridoxamine 5'-phosphate oxidase superfamily)/RimJ/RimL family protein N-acetyltransferase